MMRPRGVSEWGPQLYRTRSLQPDQWAPLRATFHTETPDAVELVLEELTGFMDFMRYDHNGKVLLGVGDGQLFISHSIEPAPSNSAVVFYASGVVGSADPDAFTRLERARSSWMDQLRIQGVMPQDLGWDMLPYEQRPKGQI